MRSIAFADFLIGVGILFVIEGLMFAAAPVWLKRAMKARRKHPTMFCGSPASARLWRD